MDDGRTKEVYFNVYCPKCEFKKQAEDEMPCYECLQQPWNEYSHRPVKFKEDAK